MKPAQQAKFQAAADKTFDDNAGEFNAQEAETIEYFKKEGKKVYDAGPERLPHLRAEALRRQIRQGLAEGRARAHQRDQVDAGNAGLLTERSLLRLAGWPPAGLLPDADAARRRPGERR